MSRTKPRTRPPKPPPPAPHPGVQPSPEFRRHHDVDPPQVDATAFRQGWQVRTRLDALLAADRITAEEWQAADAYRRTWAVARELATVEPGTLRIAGGSSPDNRVVSLLDAVTRLRVVEALVGGLRARLLLACLVHDLPWAETARYLRRDPETVRDWTVAAIHALSRAWETATGRRATDPLPEQPTHPDRPQRAS